MKKYGDYNTECSLFINLFDAMPFSVYVVDTSNYSLIFVNKKLSSLLGDIRGRKCYDAVYQEESPCHHCNIKRLLNKQQQPNGKTDIYEHFNPADEHWYQMQDKCISWPDGRQAKYSIAVDITNLKASQNRLAEAHAELTIKNRQLADAALSDLVKNDFLSAISHELRTPLNAIMGALQAAQEHPQQPLPSPLDIAQSGASDMVHLINDILCYTEMQAGKLKENVMASDVSAMIDELHDRYQNACHDNKLELIWQQEKNCPNS